MSWGDNYYSLLGNGSGTDSALYGGSNAGNGGGIQSEPIAAHGFDQSLRLMVPPLGCLLLKRR